MKGPARINASNSGIRLSGVDGEVYAKTTFAGTNVSDAAGPITVESQNGSVTAEVRGGGSLPTGFAAHYFRTDSCDASRRRGLQPDRPHFFWPDSLPA